MSIDGNPQILIVGDGVIAYELAAAYAHLGFTPIVGTLSDARVVPGPRHIVTATDAFDLEELRCVAEATGAQTVPTIEASELTSNRQRTRASANEDLGLPTLEHEFVADPGELEVKRPGFSSDRF